MKIKESIFNKFSNVAHIVATSGVLVALCGVNAFAAIDKTGCDKDENVYINPELTLCSTHVYNIGDTKNPESEAFKQLTRDVVALKSTLITQQLYAQYEFLEATLRRLRTQLQKEVLLAGLEAAGAESSKGSGTSGSNSQDKNVKLNGARNCQLESGTTAVLQCIQNNVRIVLDSINNSNHNDAKKQLQTDLEIASTWGGVIKDGKVYKSFEDGATDKKGGAMTACNAINVAQGGTTNITNCAYELNASVSKKIEALSNAQMRNQRNP